MKIWNAAGTGNVDDIQILANNGVDVTGVVSLVSMCVAMQYGI